MGAIYFIVMIASLIFLALYQRCLQLNECLLLTWHLTHRTEKPVKPVTSEKALVRNNLHLSPLFFLFFLIFSFLSVIIKLPIFFFSFLTKTQNKIKNLIEPNKFKVYLQFLQSIHFVIDSPYFANKQQTKTKENHDKHGFCLFERQYRKFHCPIQRLRFSNNAVNMRSL